MEFSDTNGYKPAPWCINGHAHTILCSLFFTSPAVHYERQIIDTPDGDFLELDIIEKGPDSPVAVLFHGLEGHSKRYYITRLARQLADKNVNIVAVNFRSCGSMMNRNRRFYHSGETEDPNTVFEWVSSQFPNSAIVSAGVSLGASALLNYLREYGVNHPLKTAAAISTPFDLHKGSLNLEKGINKVYSIRFLRTLVQKLNEKRKTYPELPTFNGSTLYEYDDQVTAPLHGFKDADDYYRSCSSAYFMDQIKTDCLVVHSEDDPMCPFQWTPIDQVLNNPKLTACFTKKGGHVGFWSLPPGWVNNRVSNYLIHKAKESNYHRLME